MKYKNLAVIGTSHIAKQSIEDVVNAINRTKPDIIAIELDKKRYAALTSKKRHKKGFSDIFKIGIKGYFFSVMGAWVEKKLGEYTGVMPGSDMLTAINIAKAQKIKLSLIDQDIAITLKRFSQTLTWREKFNFFIELISAPFKRRKIVFDLNKVPSEKIIKKLMSEVKEKYPNVYKVLILERNEIMAHNLFKLMNYHKKGDIVAIVGAGHEKEIIDIVKEKFRKLNLKK